MFINTNYSSLVARGNLTKASGDLSKTMERLSSGLRINSAADDAAGLAISERMGAQVRGMDQAYRNAQDGASLIQTAEGAMGTISDILQRVRELSVQADNGTNSGTDKTSIQDEIGKLVDEIDHIAKTATFNGISLLDGSNASITLHISDKADDTLGVSLTDVRSTALGGTTGKVNGIDVTAAGGAEKAIKIVDEALDQISKTRGGLGATQNRLDFISDNLISAKNNTAASKSRIADADMASEMSSLTKSQVLQQTTMAMLARANGQPQSVLQLLQG
ncbi:flagellin [Bacillus toyonensis]|uniref:flagellin N-terminal helical domain-containing protein n=1 Tax=Bacillus toyonensis TaxID=155322 RepID=UPI002E1B7096|nr:flagellin [Bacillus toyonensis]MED2737809.1 flagellin [Bacillus toyonensis]